MNKFPSWTNSYITSCDIKELFVYKSLNTVKLMKIMSVDTAIVIINTHIYHLGLKSIHFVVSFQGQPG